jgi:hypothetical protein
MFQVRLPCHTLLFYGAVGLVIIGIIRELPAPYQVPHPPLQSPTRYQAVILLCQGWLMLAVACLGAQGSAEEIGGQLRHNSGSIQGQFMCPGVA